jgi:peptidoglycan/LPS O-acetylase OafA/YrhL
LKHIQALDGLRGAAVLIVLCGHYFGFLGLWNGGDIGVDIFFVLSGFLITSILLAEMSATGGISLGRFYLRRALRLAPALLITVIVFGTADLAFNIYDRLNVLKSMAASLFYASNWVRALNLWNMAEFGHTWTLAIEEQFYFLWPAALLALTRLTTDRKLLLSIVLGVIVVMQVSRYDLIVNQGAFTWASASFTTRADAIFVGVLPALLFSTEWIKRPQVLRAVSFLGVAGAAAIVFPLILLRHYLVWQQPIVVFGAAMLILHLAANQGSWLHSSLSVGWLTFTGRISYGLYLYHYPLWYLTIATFGDQVSPGMPNDEKQLFCLLVLAPVSFLAAWWSYQYVEMPIRMRGRRPNAAISSAPASSPESLVPQRRPVLE